MNGYGKVTRLIITAMLVVLGALYLGSDYLGGDLFSRSRQFGRLGQLLVAMLLAALVLLGIFKLLGKLWNKLIERQAREDDDSDQRNE